ncbi:MAG: hypothetical protein GY765_04465 [bacterium]|nr:hypothetical protein [bacterium]
MPDTVSAALYVAPRTPVERALAEIWAGVLACEADTVGIDADFFRMGGHSLKGVIMTAKIHQAFGVRVPLGELFKNSTIRNLARYIKRVSEGKTSAQPGSPDDGSAVPQHVEALKKIPAVEKREYYRLSPSQAMTYRYQLKLGKSSHLNIPTFIPLPEQYDVQRLTDTFRKLILRHESLRTSFHVVQGEPVQFIHDNAAFDIEMAGDVGDTDPSHPFDLTRPPLMRAAIVSQKGRDALFVDVHHIISDGTSQGILRKEFAVLHQGGRLEPLDIQYKDYALWRNSPIQKEELRKQEEFWLNDFSGPLPEYELPIDFARNSGLPVGGASAGFYINRELTAGLKTLCRRCNITLYMILLSVFNIFLSRVCGSSDIILGSPSAGRHHADVEPLIGMFLNLLTMRNYPEGHKTAVQFMEEVGRRTINVFDNLDYQWFDLVKNVVEGAGEDPNPMYNVLFNLLNQQEVTEATPPVDEAGERIIHRSTKPKDDLIFRGVELTEVVFINVEYRTELFRQETVVGFIGAIRSIIEQIVADPDMELSVIQLP